MMREYSMLKHPSIVKEKIEKIGNALRTYITERLIKHGKDCEVLVTLLRKGNALIVHLKKDKSVKEKLDKVAFRDCIVSEEEFIERKELHNKKILIFDDAVDEGKKIREIYNKLNNLSIPKDNIKVGAFVVNKKYCKKLIEEGILNSKLICYEEDEKNFAFLKKVLDIISYIVHTGDIIDPDHLEINGSFTSLISYHDLWNILEKMKLGKIYEADFEFYHPEKKKITIYDIPYSEWIDLSNMNLLDQKFQCKIRFVFDMELENRNLVTKKFTMVPVINPKIKSESIKSKSSEKCAKLYLQFCEKYKNTNYEKLDICCVDCILYTLVRGVVSRFMHEWKTKLKENNLELEIENIEWKYLFIKYGEDFKSSTLKEHFLLSYQ